MKNKTIACIFGFVSFIAVLIMQDIDRQLSHIALSMELNKLINQFW